jgi:hypothetical protein
LQSTSCLAFQNSEWVQHQNLSVSYADARYNPKMLTFIM